MGTSYRSLPTDYPVPVCSGRTELCEAVLCDEWVSVPSGSEDLSYSIYRKKQCAVLTCVCLCGRVCVCPCGWMCAVLMCVCVWLGVQEEAEDDDEEEEDGDADDKEDGDEEDENDKSGVEDDGDGEAEGEGEGDGDGDGEDTGGLAQLMEAMGDEDDVKKEAEDEVVEDMKKEEEEEVAAEAMRGRDSSAKESEREADARPAKVPRKGGRFGGKGSAGAGGDADMDAPAAACGGKGGKEKSPPLPVKEKSPPLPASGKGRKRGAVEEDPVPAGKDEADVSMEESKEEDTVSICLYLSLSVSILYSQQSSI